MTKDEKEMLDNLLRDMGTDAAAWAFHNALEDYANELSDNGLKDKAFEASMLASSLKIVLLVNAGMI